MSSAHRRDGVAPGDAYVEEVSSGVYAYVQPDGAWWINNTGFLLGERGVVSVDACSTEARTKAYLSAIARLSSQPVRTLINTHHHGDHTHGSCFFRGATIVGHDGVREAMLGTGGPPPSGIWTDVHWGDIDIEPPFLTYSEEVTVWVDDLRCEVRHVGTAAHTTNDSIVWVPERKVLFAGDLVFNGGTPFFLMGSVTGAIEVVGSLRELGASRIVPGHGPVCGPQVLDTVEAYLRFVMEHAESARSAGLDPLSAAREIDLGDWGELSDAERIVGNLHRAYADLDLPRGAPIDTTAALADMVAYNGGNPLSCFA